MSKYIVIEGNIGAGKTTLAKLLAAEYEAGLLLEEFEENSFLKDFYEDPERYAFPLELSFLADRFTQTSKCDFHQVIVADYHISKSFVFAGATLKPEEYELFERMYGIMFAKLPVPDVMLYLDNKPDTLISNIKQRNRTYEQDISPDYLEKIDSGYKKMLYQINDVPVLVVDVDNLDFVNNSVHFERVLTLLRANHSPGVHKFDLQGS